MTSIIIVTYRSASTIEQCLAGVLIHTEPPFEVVCVDNASADSTVELVRRMAARDQRIQVIESGANVGYAPGANIGARAAKGDTLVFLNPDAIAHGPWLGPLLRALSDLKCGAAGPLGDIVGGDMWLGHYLNRSVGDFADLSRYVARNFEGQEVDTKLLVGYCVAMRRALYEEIGGMDDELVQGCDDLDLSWRLRLAGYRLAVCKDTFVQHFCGVSFNQLPTQEKEAIIRQTNTVLLRKLKEHYGDLSKISSHELWGCDIFEKALAGG